jgi:putative flippase GtrA
VLNRSISGKGLRFLAVGSACAALYFGICFFLRAGFDWSAFSATITAYAACFGLGYLGQKKLAFRSTSRHTRSLPRYAALHTAGAYLTAVSVDGISRMSSLPPVYMAVLATGVAGVASFFISYYWVFREA